MQAASAKNLSACAPHVVLVCCILKARPASALRAVQSRNLAPGVASAGLLALFWLAGNERMEKNMEATIGCRVYIGWE